MIKQHVKQGYFRVLKGVTSIGTAQSPGILNRSASNALSETTRKRAEFFVPDIGQWEETSNVASAMMRFDPCLVVGYDQKSVKWMKRLRPGVFNVDQITNPLDGWEWLDVLSYATNWQVDLSESKQRWRQIRDHHQRMGLSKAYIFGTGPSLELAANRNWDDGIRIVSNTIVRDPDLWRHISPDIFVAGDGIYHFGFTEFAKRFRNDLRDRLSEKPAPFVYPAQFDALVQREFRDFGSLLVPIPVGTGTEFQSNLEDRYELPGLGNVLNLLLLPLACNLSKNVGLWGFDGRAPVDTGFWSNSPKQSYPELLPKLHEAHPAFFSANVPVADPLQYVRKVHGDVLERGLQSAERAGWTFGMLHETYTETLAKRRRSERAGLPNGVPAASSSTSGSELTPTRGDLS